MCGELVENFRSAKEKEDEYEFCPQEAWYFVFESRNLLF